jgi:hypothetical protein
VVGAIQVGAVSGACIAGGERADRHHHHEKQREARVLPGVADDLDEPEGDGGPGDGPRDARDELQDQRIKAKDQSACCCYRQRW